MWSGQCLVVCLKVLCVRPESLVYACVGKFECTHVQSTWMTMPSAAGNQEVVTLTRVTLSEVNCSQNNYSLLMINTGAAWALCLSSRCSLAVADVTTFDAAWYCASSSSSSSWR